MNDGLSGKKVTELVTSVLLVIQSGFVLKEVNGFEKLTKFGNYFKFVVNEKNSKSIKG